MRWFPGLGQRRPGERGPGGAPEPAQLSQRTAIVTDSAAALPGEWLADACARGGLSVVPMPVMIAGNIYGEGIDHLDDVLALALVEGQNIQTSRPSPGQFERVYRMLGERGYTAVVSIHISSGLSGTADAAKLAAARVDVPVEVVDSRSVGMGQGFAVQQALSVAESGASLAQTAAAAVQAVADTSVLFYVPSLDQLRRGGRIGAAASWFGTVFAIKPILALSGGVVVPLERVRSAPRAVARLEERSAQDFQRRYPATRSWAVHHFGNEEPARQLSLRLAARVPGAAAPQLTPLPAVLAAHAGLGVLAVIVAGPGPTPEAIGESSSTGP